MCISSHVHDLAGVHVRVYVCISVPADHRGRVGWQKGQAAPSTPVSTCVRAYMRVCVRSRPAYTCSFVRVFAWDDLACVPRVFSSVRSGRLSLLHSYPQTGHTNINMHKHSRICKNASTHRYTQACKCTHILSNKHGKCADMRVHLHMRTRRAHTAHVCNKCAVSRAGQTNNVHASASGHAYE